MNLIVNGQQQTSDAPTISALITVVAPGARRVAVELNGEILPRSEYATRALKDGDRIEIVHAIGGG